MIVMLVLIGAFTFIAFYERGPARYAALFAIFALCASIVAVIRDELRQQRKNTNQRIDR